MSTTTKELKVLLIEDNPGDAFLMKFYLGESTSPLFHVSHAENLKSAMDLLAENHFDIILSDMNMPDSYGVDTIKSIMSNYPGNLVIVLTGLTDEEVGLETVRYGAQDFLVKGKFDGKVLVSSVMFAFERFKLNKQLDEENSRLSMLQQLTGVGYFEIDTTAQKHFFTKTLQQLLGSDEELKRMTEMLSATDASGDRHHETAGGKKFIIRCLPRDNKLCGVVIPA